MFWETLDRQSPEELALYLAQYPNGVFAALARARLARLRSAPSAAPSAAGRAESARAAEADSTRPGDRFRDCAECPEMVVVPAGSFWMGSADDDEDGFDVERPRHEVRIAEPFAIGVYEVTFAQWDACVAAGGCGDHQPNDLGWGRGNRPVMRVNWNDAQAYVRWLSEKTGERYRLPSESEWEYAARAGTATGYWWGDEVGGGRANCTGDVCGDRFRFTASVGSFAANPWGLHDVHGNVEEWVEDCWNGSYRGAPSDGTAWTAGDCSRRVLRGGSWGGTPRNLRAANRLRLTTGDRINGGGFRVSRSVRTLTP